MLEIRILNAETPCVKSAPAMACLKAGLGSAKLHSEAVLNLWESLFSEGKVKLFPEKNSAHSCDAFEPNLLVRTSKSVAR